MFCTLSEICPFGKKKQTDPNNNNSNNKKHFPASQCSCQISLSPPSHLCITIYIYLYICCYLHYSIIQGDTYRRLSTQWKLASLGSDLVSGTLFLYMWHLCTGLGALPWCSFSCWLGAKHRFVLHPPPPQHHYKFKLIQPCRGVPRSPGARMITNPANKSM